MYGSRRLCRSVLLATPRLFVTLHTHLKCAAHHVRRAAAGEGLVAEHGDDAED